MNLYLGKLFIGRSLSSGGKFYLTWIRDGQLVLCDDLNTKAQRLIRDDCSGAHFLGYTLTVNSRGDLVILWFNTDTAGNDLFYRVYDAQYGHWSRDLRLEQDDGVEKYFEPFFSSSGELIMTYNKNIIQYVNKEVNFQGEQIVIENVPQPGKNDLYLAQYTLTSDLTLEPDSITLSDPNPHPGDTVTVSATVENTGDFTVDTMHIDFYEASLQDSQRIRFADHPSYPSALISSLTLSEPLHAGEKRTFSVLWHVPKIVSSHRIFADVDSQGEIKEKNESDNSASVITVLPDITVWGGEVTQRGNQLDITIKVENKGSLPACNIPVEYRLNDDKGKVIATQIIPSLAVGEMIEQRISWDLTGQEYPDGQLFVYVHLDTNIDFLEQNPENNASRIQVIDTTKPEIVCPEEITIIQYTQDGARIEFAAEGKDNLDKKLTLTSQPPSGSSFPPGDTLITITATDDYGNEDTCSFIVTVPAAQPKLSLFPGLNLIGLPPGAGKTWHRASSVWQYFWDQGITLSKIQTYRPDSAQLLTYRGDSQEDFPLNPSMGWMVYLDQDDLTTFLLPSFSNFTLSSISSVNLSSGKMMINPSSLLPWIRSPGEPKLDWEEKLFQCSQGTLTPKCIIGYNAPAGKWQGRHQFFGQTAGDKSEIKNGGCIVNIIN